MGEVSIAFDGIVVPLGLAGPVNITLTESCPVDIEGGDSKFCDFVR